MEKLLSVCQSKQNTILSGTEDATDQTFSRKKEGVFYNPQNTGDSYD
jgi:hypothetical protein